MQWNIFGIQLNFTFRDNTALVSLVMKVVTSLEEGGNVRFSRDLLDQQNTIVVELPINSREDLLQILPGKVMHGSLDHDLVIADVPGSKHLRRLAKSLNVVRILLQSHIEHLLDRFDTKNTLFPVLSRIIKFDQILNIFEF